MLHERFELGRRVTVAHDADVERGVSEERDGTVDGVVDPRGLVAEGTAAVLREKHEARSVALGIEQAGPKSGFVGGRGASSSGAAPR